MKIVFNSDGRCARLIAKHPEGGFLVELAWDNGSGEDCGYGGFELWGEILDKPPVEILDSRVAVLKDTIKNMKSEIRALDHECATVTKGHTELIAKLKAQSAALVNIDDFLEGRITYYVVGGSYYFGKPGRMKIVDMNDPKGEAFYERERKLLVLFGWKGLDLQWALASYYDGSCSDHKMCFPCVSREQAIEKMQELTLAQIKELDDTKSGEGLETVCVNCRVCGLEIPEWITDEISRRERVAAEKKVKDLEFQLAVVRKGLPTPTVEEEE